MPKPCDIVTGAAAVVVSPATGQARDMNAGREEEGPEGQSPEPPARHRGQAAPGQLSGQAAPGQLSRPGAGSAGDARPAPPRAPVPPPPAARGPAPSPASGARERWPSVVTTLGAALLVVVGLQIVLAITAGISLNRTGAGAEGLHHRLGVAFGGLGGATALLLLLGFVFQTVPALVGRSLTAGQQRVLRVSVPAVASLAAVLSIGSVLAVVSQLNEYTLRGLSAPAYARLQLGTFLVGAIGISGIAIAAAYAGRGLAQEPPAAA